MEETAPAGMFAFTGPVLYATSAVVITAAALVFGYLYTQKHAKQVAKTSTTTKDGKTADAHKTKGKDGKQKTVDSSVPLGTWPVDGEDVNDEDEEDEDEEDEEDLSQKVFPMPEDAPENIKRILEMGFPGCPMFRRTTQTEGLVKPGDFPGLMPLSHMLGAHSGTSPPPAPRMKSEAQKTTVAKGREAQANGKGKAGTKAADKGDHAKDNERDPVEYCSHLQSEVKRTQQKVAASKIEEEMTTEQKEHERDVQREQLEAIFKLMQKQEDKFGVDSMDDIQSQMKLYV